MARPSAGPKLVLFGPDTRHGATKRAGFSKYTYYAQWYENSRRRLSSLNIDWPNDPSPAWRKFQITFHEHQELLAGPALGQKDINLGKLIYSFMETKRALAKTSPLNQKPLLSRCKMLAAYFADYNMSDINEALCIKYAATRRSIETARSELGTLKSILNYGVRSRFITWRPDVWKPRQGPPRDRVLTRKEIAAILRHMRASPRTRHHAIAVVCAYHTAGRIDSVVTLGFTPSPEGGHIDTVNGLIHLNPAGRPRTNKRKPTIRIPRGIRAIVYARASKHKYLITNTRGKRMTAKQHRRIFDQSIKAVGIEHASPHTLRHTRITELVLSGIPLARISTFTGLTVDRLMKTYSHLLPEHTDMVADAVVKSNRHSNRQGFNR